MPDDNDLIYTGYDVGIVGVLEWLLNGGLSSGDTSFLRGSESVFLNLVANVIEFVSNFWSIFVVLSWLFTALLIFGIVYAYVKANQMEEIIDENIHEQEKLYKQLYASRVENKRWEDINVHIGADTPHQWRLAIIEADILLGEVLDAAGYAGNTIGDQLKSASPQSFKTLDQAWRAHRVRNQIAHEGADFILTKKMAQDTITQYKMVFEEFDLL